MFPAGNILGKFCAFSGLFREKDHKEAIIRLKAGAADTPITSVSTTPAIWYLTFGSVAR